MSFELVGVKLVADGGAQYFGTMNKAEQAVVDYGRTTDRTFKQMPGLADLAVGALHRVGAIAVDVFMQAGRAAVGFFGDSISAAGDFESGMNKFAAVAGGALEESGLKLKDFRDQFIQIGKELPVSTAEVQDAAIEMVKGGIEPATIAAGGLKQVIQFAAAADLDLAQASTIAAKALGGWVAQTATAEEKASFLTHSTDLLSRAANASTVNVDDLALGLYNVQGTAKLAGLSFDETVTTLAELAPSFSSSADAGTSFKTFLARLQPTTKPAIAAMEDLGLFTEETGSAFYDAKGNFIGMEKASQILADATKDLTNEQKQQALQTIFGQDGIRVAAVLAEKGAEGYDAMTASLAKQNSVADMAKQKQAGFNTAMDNFKGSVEALQITIGSALLPVLTDLFNNYLAPGINVLTDLAAALFGDYEAFAKLPQPIQDVINFFAPLVEQAKTAIEYFFGLDQKAQGISNALAVMGGTAGTVTQTLSPFQEIIQAVGGYLQTTIFPILTDLGTALFPLVNAAIEVAAGFWNDVLWPALNTFWNLLNATVIPILGDLAHWLAENLPGAIATARDFLTGTLFPAMHDVYDFIDKNVIPILGDAATWLRENVPVAIQKAANFWNNTLWPALDKVWGFINTNVIPILSTVVTWLRDNIPPAVQKVADFWTNTLLPAIKDVWSFIDKNIIPIIGALVNVWWALMKKELQILSDVWTKVFLPAITVVYDWFNDKIIPILDDAGKGAGVLGGVLRDTLGPAFTWLGDNVLKPAVGWFNDIGSAVSGAVKWLNDLAETINNLPSLPDPFVGHSPPPIANWMADIAGGALTASAALADVATTISNLPSSLPSWVGDIGGSLSLGGSGSGAGLFNSIASPNAMAMRGGGSTSATYNQQRTTNLTYHTQYAPPAQQSLAIANALAGGS